MTDRKNINRDIIIKIIPNTERISTNDPIISKKFFKELNLINAKTIVVNNANNIGYNLLITDILCSCCCKNTTRFQRKELFFNALSLYNYYLDITTYFKKMMEVDIIKYYLFTKNERTLISVISNPDLSIDKFDFERKLNSQYNDFNKENFETKIEMLLKDVIKEGRNRTNINRILQLIQNGNEDIFEY